MNFSENNFDFNLQKSPRMNELTLREYELVRQEFNWIKNKLFEKWDESGEWIPDIFHFPHDLAGMCDHQRKIIWIHNHLLWTNSSRELCNLAELRVTLIHEICHARTPIDRQHGADWIQEIEMALERLLSLSDVMDECELNGEHYCRFHESSDTVATDSGDDEPLEFLNLLYFEVARYGGWTKCFFPKLTPSASGSGSTLEEDFGDQTNLT